MRTLSDSSETTDSSVFVLQEGWGLGSSKVICRLWLSV
jgi:hypothetical protein